MQIEFIYNMWFDYNFVRGVIVNRDVYLYFDYIYDICFTQNQIRRHWGQLGSVA